MEDTVESNLNIYEVENTDKKGVRLNVRINPKIKKQAIAELKLMDISMSTAVRMFLEQIVINKAIPFPIPSNTENDAFDNV